MVRSDRTLERILLGFSDANISFEDLRRLLNDLGFSERRKGSHHIYVRQGVEEIVNIQPRGSEAKLYQVKQVRNIVLKYKLTSSNE
jgi:predicted RNA binding protein YcfA (HicA-like mRNA interferase family)